MPSPSNAHMAPFNIQVQYNTSLYSVFCTTVGLNIPVEEE